MDDLNIQRGCIREYTCPHCKKHYSCIGVSQDPNTTYIEGPCCCGYICTKCEEGKKVLEELKNCIPSGVSSPFEVAYTGLEEANTHEIPQDPNLYSSMIQSINVSLDLGREEINELGRRGPYSHTLVFPTEVQEMNKNQIKWMLDELINRIDDDVDVWESAASSHTRAGFLKRAIENEEYVKIIQKHLNEKLNQAPWEFPEEEFYPGL